MPSLAGAEREAFSLRTNTDTLTQPTLNFTAGGDAQSLLIKSEVVEQLRTAVTLQ
jgi:hypothetical protein